MIQLLSNHKEMHSACGLGMTGKGGLGMTIPYTLKRKCMMSPSWTT